MTKEELTAKVVAAPAQAVPAPGVEAVSEREFKQFLSDVLTAAGLVTHGKKCKDLGRRLGEMSMRLLTAPRTAAAPSDAPHAELRKTWREGQRWQTRGDPAGPWLDTTPCWHADREYRRHPDDAAVTTALLAAERESLQCDYCGAVTDDPWHSSGMLHGQLSRHIHSCDICAAQPLHVAAINCPHEIDKDRVVLHYDSKQPGKNALAQLAARLQAAQAQLEAVGADPDDEAVPANAAESYTQRVIEALYENGDPVSVDAAEELQRLATQLGAVGAGGVEPLVRALEIAEAALADIGDADREPGDDVAWCEARAAQALPGLRAVLITAAPQPAAQAQLDAVGAGETLCKVNQQSGADVKPLHRHCSLEN